jgi:hypothetical protein
MKGNNRNFVIQRYRNHGVHAEWREVRNGEGGTSVRTFSVRCHIRVNFILYFRIRLLAPFQRPLVGTNSHTKHTNEFSGRASNARRISAEKFVRTYK